MKVHKRYMDWLVVVSAFAVVELHCSTAVFLNIGDLSWKFDVVVQSIFIFAVPIFFMISGANLLGYRSRYSTAVFLKKRFSKVCSALFLCSFFIYVLSCFVPVPLGLPARVFSVKSFIHLFLKNEISDVYWFLYAILILYLITPIIALLIQKKRLLEYTLVLSGISTFLIPAVSRYVFDSQIFSLLSISYLSGNIFYYLWGYYCSEYIDEGKIGFGPLVLSAVFLPVVMSILTIRTNVLYTQPNNLPFDNFFYGITGVFAPIYSTCLFLTFKKLSSILPAHILTEGVIPWFCRQSFGVYMVHMLFITTLDRYIAHSIQWDIFIRPIVIFLISALSVYSMKRALNAVRKLLEHSGLFQALFYLR